ncbi:ATP-binding cassette domain-containing protein [Gemmobacter lanyuensis]
MINGMVGREFTFEHRAPAPNGDRPVLEVRGLSRGSAFRDISFDLRQGEILGLAGLIGAGRSEVGRALSGADLIEAGEIRLDGRALRLSSPRDAIEAGIVMVSEDRKGLGLSLNQSAARNIAQPWERRLARAGMVMPAAIDDLGRTQQKRFDIRGRMELPVSSMSGGNQQKVLLAKWLVKTPRVFIVDEPTRGVDVGAKMAIYEIIRELAASGISVIVISSELEEVLGLCHRVMVMSGGRIRGELPRAEATPERVMSLAVVSSADAHGGTEMAVLDQTGQKTGATQKGKEKTMLNAIKTVQRFIPGPLIGLILVCIVFSTLSPYFLTTRNMFNIFSQMSEIGIMAAGAALVIIIGGSTFRSAQCWR